MKKQFGTVMVPFTCAMKLNHVKLAHPNLISCDLPNSCFIQCNQTESELPVSQSTLTSVQWQHKPEALPVPVLEVRKNK